MGLFDFLTGDDEKETLRQRSDEANALIEAGRRDAASALTTGRDEAIATLEPTTESGDLARENLLVFLGLRGPEAQQEAFTAFNDDPGFQATQDAGIEAIERSAAAGAGGGLSSGGTKKELFQFGQRGKFSQFQDRLNRLAGLTSTGDATRTNIASLKSGTGAQLADLNFGTGQLRANNAINLGNAEAAASNIGFNNLVSLGTAAAKVAGAV